MYACHNLNFILHVETVVKCSPCLCYSELVNIVKATVVFWSISLPNARIGNEAKFEVTE